LDKELYQRILPQSSGYDSEPPKNINKKTTKSCAYKKFENYCNEQNYNDRAVKFFDQLMWWTHALKTARVKSKV
jgi:hypothetical protein